LSTVAAALFGAHFTSLPALPSLKGRDLKAEGDASVFAASFAARRRFRPWFYELGKETWMTAELNSLCARFDEDEVNPEGSPQVHGFGLPHLQNRMQCARSPIQSELFQFPTQERQVP
jgi:hypothetical protein